MLPLLCMLATTGRRRRRNNARVRLNRPRVLQSLLQEHLRCHLDGFLHEFRTAPAIQRHLEVRRIFLWYQESFVHATIPVEVSQIVTCIVAVIPTTLKEYPTVIARERGITLCPTAVDGLGINELTRLLVEYLYLCRWVPDMEESLVTRCSTALRSLLMAS